MKRDMVTLLPLVGREHAQLRGRQEALTAARAAELSRTHEATDLSMRLKSVQARC